MLENKIDSDDIVVRFHDPYPDDRESSNGVVRYREINDLASAIRKHVGVRSILT